MSRLRTGILGLALGISLTGVVLWVANALLLAVYTGFFWAVGGWLTTHNATSIPGLLRGTSDWSMTARLWSGAFGGLLALSASAMIGPQVPVTAETGLALGLFVIGVAITMANLGVALALSLETEGVR